MALTAGLVAEATGGRITSGTASRAISGASIDSRSIRPGELFFAIVAARDGHAFVGDALERGAAGAVVSAPIGTVRVHGGETPVLIEVGDTTLALQALARHVRRASRARVVAITGSVGKTTTKEAIAAVLGSRFRVVRNRGNFNNHLGLPLSLLELANEDADVAVMELGMNHAGEIRVLVGIAEPDVRVWTNVGEAHIGYFGSVDAVADAKAEILEQATPSSVLVANADDERIVSRIGAFPGRVVTFGEHERADARAIDVEERGVEGVRARLVTRAGTREVRLPLVGRGNLANALAAAAVGLELDVPLDDIASVIGALKPAAGRGVVTTVGGVTIVDDSYNASPTAMRQALAVLAHESRARRTAAVLGEMLELGEQSLALHKEIGALAARAGVRRLVTVGGEAARALGEAAVAAGLPPASVTHHASSDSAGADIVGWLEPGDVVLVKGSRGIRTDLVVARMAAELA